MSDVQLYLLEVDRNKTEAKAIAERSAIKLEKKELKLIDLITSLNEYINKKDDSTTRAHTLQYLAEVLDVVPQRVLSNQERRLLVDFLLGRLEGDTEGIGATARSLIALESKGKWDAATAQKVVQTFVNHVNPLKQFKLQSERYAAIQLIDLCLAKYRNAIHDVQQEDASFLPRFIMLFDGEKDPRNLMIVFSLLQVPMTEWNIQSYAQDLFEAVFNYFPITFKPPPDDPYGITAQDLKDRLRQCISSTSDFAPHAFPALLDKLDSTSMNTKRDVLQAMQDCIVNYEPQTINLYSVTLWDALKFEILTPQEEDLAQEALKALGLIAATLTPAGDGPLNAYLRPVIKECNEHLEDAPTKQSQAAGRILHAIASGSPQTADKLVKGILPVLFELHKSTESISKRRGLLEVLNDILRAFVDMATSGDATMTESLQVHSSDALEAFLRALTHAPKAEVSFRLVSLDGLVHLTSIPGVLSEEQINRILDVITDLILHERIPGHGDIRTPAIEHLVQLARVHPNLVQAKAVPAFMVELPDVPHELADYSTCLEAFAHLSIERQIFDVVVLRLKSKYSAAKHQGAPQQYQRDLLRAMLYAFLQGAPIKEDGIVRSSYFSQFAEPLLDTLADGDLTTYSTTDLEVIGRLCNCLLREQSSHFQSSVYNTRRSWLLQGIEDPASVSRTQQLAPFLLHFYAALRPEVVEAQDVIVQLQSIAGSVLSSAQIDDGVASLLRLTTLLINKCLPPKEVESALRATRLDAAALLPESNQDRQLLLAFSVTKALVLQGKTTVLTKAYLQDLLALLPTASKHQAHYYETLLAPDEILDKANHCVISGLYKQRTFTQLIPPIVEAVRGSDQVARPNLLIALSGVLRWLPYSVVQPRLYTLVASLLQTLDLTGVSPDIKLSALTIFESVLMHDPSDISEHTASLISRLLACTSMKEKDAKVRAKALQSLAIMPKQLKREMVIPYRKQVVKQLMSCLDDGKRNVRTEAVRCRTNWLGLEETDEDE
ncbi:hypothetical protein AMS68_003359 [Peltaster fructicola]|uniref:MMS19 nucleotide excision repair protein n=1 Tax=Peltaster fructicola TaxID=286661 RepID=A0A6H0XSU4_9PEZI|nr:hypothetical protein AMS68_003359 [Peltaster fructicola]